MFSFSDSQRAVKLYMAWFCPFAQRVRISLLAKGVDFDIQDIDPYDKTPEFLAINPRGLVPAIIHNGKCVYESAVCIEYVDEAFSSDTSLLPTGPYGRAYVRIWSDFIGKGIAPLFYQMLRLPEKLQEIKTELLKNLAEFSRNISDDGPFFTGKTFGMVDIMLVPFTLRLYILKHYRGFEIPQTADYAKLRRWMTACHVHESVLPTLADHKKLLQNYKRFVDNVEEAEVSVNA